MEYLRQSLAEPCGVLPKPKRDVPRFRKFLFVSEREVRADFPIFLETDFPLGNQLTCSYANALELHCKGPAEISFPMVKNIRKHNLALNFEASKRVLVCRALVELESGWEK